MYADCGISGTDMAKRGEFQRMLADCEAGKIDIMDDDVERKGLGTPATRAGIIEKLVKDWRRYMLNIAANDK